MQHRSFGIQGLPKFIDIIIQEAVKNEKKSHFRYKFLVPPMRTKRIIEPISLEDNVLIEKSKSLFSFLEQ
jgi:hypothetical protein